MTRIIYFLLIIVMIGLSCSKEKLSPSENLIGKWELVSIDRMDTVFLNSRYHNGYIALKINYNKDPLVISYDTLGNFRSHTDLPFTFISSHTEYIYNLIYRWEIFSDGAFEITEEYRNLNNIPFRSYQYSSIWNRQEEGIDNYEFNFQVSDPFENPYPSIIFQLAHVLILHDENVEKNSFTIYESDNHDSNSNALFVYRFEK